MKNGVKFICMFGVAALWVGGYVWPMTAITMKLAPVYVNKTAKFVVPVLKAIDKW